MITGADVNRFVWDFPNAITRFFTDTTQDISVPTVIPGANDGSMQSRDSYVLPSGWDRLKDSAAQTYDHVRDLITGSDPDLLPDKANTGPSAASGLLNGSTTDYLNADLARHYGMSSATAYQEALANTSYQRAVKDMQAAGLNPASLLGSGRASGSGGVSYVSSAGTGSGGNTNSGRLFSAGIYNGLSIAAGLIAAASTRHDKTSAFYIGQNAAKSVMSIIDEMT